MPKEPKVDRRKIADLKPDPSNANAGTERGLRILDDSIAETGLGRSIVVDRNGFIIGGNKTAERSIDRGFEDAVVVHTDGKELVVVQRDDLDLMDADPNNPARKLAYFDNVTSQHMAWDANQIAADVAAGVDLSHMFTPLELGDILASVDMDEPPGDPGAQIDRAAELQEKWQVKRGDLWLIGNHRLLCGDSTNAEDVGRVMGGDCASLVVTDPPYGVEYADKNKFLNAIAPGNRIQTPIAGDHGSKTDIQDTWKSAFKNMSDVMSPGAVVYCFMPQGGDQMMMMMMMMGAGIEPRHELIWLKNNHVLGRVDYAYKHEPILYAWKDGGHKFYGGFQTSIIEVDKPLKNDMHPTMKPIDLIEKLIINSSLRDEVVYDPFLGSGTTLVACEQSGRRGRGLELEVNYAAVILERMSGLGLEPRLSE